jgi:hypothetical protein
MALPAGLRVGTVPLYSRMYGRPTWGATPAHHHRNIEPADSIRRLGFARWYERRLIEGHAWFITVVMCMIAIAACMEELNFRGSIARLLAYVTFILAAVAIGIYGMVRYRKILVEAEQLGERATCGACGAYARFRLISPSRVRCRKCDNEWCLIDPG